MTTPNQQVPDGSMTKYGKWGAVQAKTQADWKAGEQANWQAAYTKPSEWGQAVNGALASHGQLIQDLQDQNQVLEGVIGYGQWTDMNVTQYPSAVATTQNVATQVGPVIGCTLVSPGVVQLGSKGLWDITGRFYFGGYSGVYVSNAVQYVVEVSADNFATIFSSAFYQIIPVSTGGISPSVSPGSIAIQARVVVPEAGYRVRWRITIAPRRNVGAGVYYNEVGVLKLSDELGPGMRLRQPFTISGTDWVRLGTMIPTGGATVSSDQITVPVAMSSGRVDAVVVGDRPFSLQLRKNGTAVETSTNLAAHHIVNTSSLAINDKLDLWVRGDGANIAASNASWLTLMNMDTLSNTAPSDL